MKAMATFGKINFEFDSPNMVELFNTLSDYGEVFSITKCECCGSENISFRVRKDDEDNKYHEMCCNEYGCWGKLSFGETKKDKKLFPKRRKSYDDDKAKKLTFFGYKGWYRFNAEPQNTETPKNAKKSLVTAASKAEEEVPY